MTQGDTQITIAGNLVDDPELRFTPQGQPVARFGVASVPWVYDKASGEWRDGEGPFLTASVWKQQPENVWESVTRGTRVVVTGRLKQRSYETKARPRKAGSGPCTRSRRTTLRPRSSSPRRR